MVVALDDEEVLDTFCAIRATLLTHRRCLTGTAADRSR